ncbi:MAG: HAD-IIIA family hydrolase [Helicobacteraceae bacterium]|nr:HAD-IIIA family hydrolase [Helicobacteraceae bacterium]
MIELIVLDVDGCLSNGQITYSEDEVEIKSFNVKDGLAIRSWGRLGKKIAIITGRESKIVERRAGELKVDFIHQGISDKATLLNNIVDELGITMQNVAAIGDDMNDYKMLKSVGLSFTPNDGSKHIKEIVNTVLETKGGDGAVREMIELLLKRDNLEEEFLDLWR